VGRVVDRFDHVRQMGETDSKSKRSLFPGTDFSPSLCLSPNPFTIIVNPK
jgi:hypothetical protein